MSAVSSESLRRGTGELPLPLPWGEAGNRLGIELDRGATYRLLCHTARQKQQILETLARQDGVAILSQNGGLLNHLSLRENLLLPSAYHGAEELQDEVAQEATDLLRECGVGRSPEALAAWLQASPSGMGKLERRLTGFVRALLSRPTLLVFDHVFEGLTRAEGERVQDWRRLLQQHLPLRTALFVDLDFNGLPNLDNCHVATDSSH